MNSGVRRASWGVCFFVSGLLAGAARADVLTWDADPATPGAQDGAGVWNAAGTNWWNGAANTNWSDATPDGALIGTRTGAGGTIALDAPRTAASVVFAQPLSGTHVLTNGALNPGTGGISMAGYMPTNLLLDTLTQPAAGAWSLRRLRTAYTGAVMQVRRPSDGALQDIGFDGGGFMDTNALALFLGTETGRVAVWYDQSGNGRDGVQANTNSQPQIHNPNGRWAVLGRGSQWLIATNCTVGQMTQGGSNGTVALVYRAQNVGQVTYGWAGGTNRWHAHVNWSDGTLYFDTADASASRLTAANGGNNGVWQQYVLTRSNANAAIRWGGAARATSANRTGFAPGTGTTWGVLGGAGAASAQGDMAEYLQFPAGLGPANLQAVEIDQGLYYGIAVSAPAYYQAVVASPVTTQVAQTWAAGGGAQLTVSGAVDNNGNLLTVSGDGYVTLSGALTGTGGLAKTGAGGLLLSGPVASGYSGPTSLTNGQLGLAKTGGAIAVPGDLTADNTLSPDVYTMESQQFAPGAVLRITGAGGDHVRLELLGTTQTLAGVDNVAGTTRGVIQQREQVTATNVGAASRLVLNGAGSYNFNGYFRDTGGLLSLTKSGSGTQTLAGANITFTGPTVVEAGRLILSNATGFASALSNAAVVEFMTSAAANYGKALTGTGLWFKTGSATMSFNGGQAVAPAGQLFLQQGVLQNNNNAVNWSNNLAGIDISAGAVLDLYADPVLTPSLTGAGTVRATYGNTSGYSGSIPSTERLTVGLTNASSVFAGTLTDTGTNGAAVGKGFLELLKVGAGTFTLSGTNTHYGPTLVAGGTLALAASGSLSNSMLISVSNGAVFDVSAAGRLPLGTNQALGGAGIVAGDVVAQAGSRLVPGGESGPAALGTLTINGSVGLHAGATNTFQLTGVTNAGGGFNDLVQITGHLAPSGSVVRIEPQVPLAGGSYRLFEYGGTKSGSFNPSPVFPSNSGRRGGYLDESVPGVVSLVVTGAYAGLVWQPGANALWNSVDANWTNAAAGAADVFLTFDAVTFDETGAYSNVVTLAAAVTPGAVTVAGASNYTFAGAAIAGAAGLTKSGAGTLVLLNTNTFTGPTTVEGGVLQLGFGGNFANLGGTVYINVTNAGTLALFASNNQAFAPVLRGNGTWLLRGPGVSGQGHIEPSGDNTAFSGPIVVTNCRLVLNSPLDTGAGNGVVQDRGQVWFLAGVHTQAMTITGLGWPEGSGQLGAIRLSSATNYGPVTLDGYARVTTYSTGERGVLAGPITGGTNTLEIWNGNGGFTYLTGTNEFAALNLLGGWTFATHGGALGGGTIRFNGGGLSAYIDPLIVTNLIAPGVIAMNIGLNEGSLPVTLANTITLTNTHVDTYIYNTTTVIGAFSGGTRGIYKYAAGHLRFAGTNTMGWVDCIQAGTVSFVSNSISQNSGNLNLRAGSTVHFQDNAQMEASQSFLGNGAAGSWGTLNIQGGRLRLNSLDGTRVLTIGEYPGATSYVNLYGGELVVTNGTGRTYIGWDGGGLLRIHGGLALLRTVRADGTAGGIDLDGGELRLGGVLEWTAGPQPAINLGGGTLSAFASWTSSVPMSVNASNGVTQVDPLGNSITLSGALSGTGGLAKVGAGTLHLDGTNNAGPVAVSAGTLAGLGTINAPVAVGAGAALQPGHELAAGPLTATAVTFAADAVFNPLVNGTASVLRVLATNGLVVPSGANTAVVNVVNNSLVAGTYTLIDYEGTIQGGSATNLVLGATPLRAVMYLTNNAASTSIDLVVVTAAEPIRWIGAVDGTWDVNAPTNWATALGGLPTAYWELAGVGDRLLFDDAAAGNFTIALQTNVAPLDVVASNALNNYTLGGAYGIGGATRLQKYGAARFTLAMNNTYAGGTVIHEGTLQLGDGVNAGSAGSGPVTNNGMLVLAHAQTNVFANPVRGTGALEKAGPGQVTLSAVNTYSGSTLVSGGLLVLSGTIASNSPVTVTTGAVLSAVAATAFGNAGALLTPGLVTLDGGQLSNDSPTNNTQVLNGNLVLRGGGTLAATAIPNATFGHFFLYNNASRIVSTGEVQNTISAELHMAGTHTVDVHNGAAPVDLLAGNRLSHHHGTAWGGIAKTGAGTLRLACTSNTTAGTVLAGGRVTFVAGGLGWGDTPANKAGYYLADFAADTELVWEDGNTQDLTTNDNLRIRTGATAQLDVGTNQVSFGRGIVGDGGLVKLGAGSLTLHAANSYPGPVTVSNGALLVHGIIDSPVTVAAGTLGGTGVIGAAITSDGTVAPGPGLGQLVVGNYAQGAPGSLVVELGGVGSPGAAYDQLVVAGTANLGGALHVALTNGFVPSTGDVFTIMFAASVNGTFATTNLPALASGLGWYVDYSVGGVQLSVTGSTSVAGYDLAATVITNGLTGYQDDADGDGFANLLEYVTGGSLTNAGIEAKMQGTRTNGLLALRFTRNTNAVDATLIVEGSGSAANGATWLGIATNIGGSWGAATNVISAGTNSPLAETVYDTDEGTNRFLRLRVTRP